MVHAVADKLPSLLPFVLMVYQQRSPLVIQRVDGSHDVLWSEAGVRHGDSMGPLLFALTYQPTLHTAQEHAADAVVTACHDDTYLRGQEAAVVAGARRIMSHHACQPRKTLVYCADPDRTQNVAAKPGAAVATGGFVACGIAMGSDAFIAQHVQQRCDSTCAQVEAGRAAAGSADKVERAAQLPATPRGPRNAKHMVAPAGSTPAPSRGRAGPRHLRHHRCNKPHG